jgi:hypothetical protein
MNGLNKVPKEHGRTWFIDIDGTIFIHNRYLNHPGEIEKPLPHAKEFLKCIPKHDTIILTTGRSRLEKKTILASLKKAHLRCDDIIFGLPNGNRILINDEKLIRKGTTAIGVTVARNGRHGSEHHKLSKKLYKLIDSGKL